MTIGQFAALVLPEPGRLPVVAAVAAVAILGIGLGRLAVRGARPAEALAIGWGAAVFAFVAIGTLAPLSFRIVATAVALAGAAGVAVLLRDRREDRVAWGRAGRIVALSLPLVLVISAMRAPTQWDELTHWLPNAHFLAAHDRFPGADLPNLDSVWPAYPYGLPLLSYLSGLLLGRFSDIAGALENLVLLIALAGAVADLIEERRPPETRLGRWGAAAAALVIAIPLNPGFLIKTAFTSYGDSATGGVLAIAAMIGLRWTEAIERSAGERCRLALAGGFAMTLLVNLKEGNLVLAGLLVAGVAASLLFDGRLRDWRTVSGLLALPAPLFAAALWHHYATSGMPQGAYEIMPASGWHLADIGTIASSMLRVVLSKGWHFGLMLVLALLAVSSVFRPVWFDTRARMLCRVATVLFIGDTAFLFAVYVAVFPEDLAVRAASFWRYAAQLGPMATVAIVAAALPYWCFPARLAAPAAAGAILLAAAPFVAVKSLRFDIQHPHDGYLLAVSRDLSAMLPPGARIDLLDPQASLSNLLLVSYHLRFDARHDIEVSVRARPADLATLHPAPGEYVWIANGGPEVEAIFGSGLRPGSSYLLRYDADGYHLVRAWPDTPETERFSPADFAG